MLQFTSNPIRATAIMEEREKERESKEENGNLSEASSSFARYVKHLIQFSKVLGMWELGSDYSKLKAALVTLNTAVLLTSNFLLGVSEMIKLSTGLGLNGSVSAIATFWLHILGFYKWLYFIWSAKDLANLIGELEQCYKLSLKMCRLDESFGKLEEEMNTAKKHSMTFFYVWTTFVMYGGVHWCLNPLFIELSTEKTNETSYRKLPFETWIPWDIVESRRGYGFAYAIELLGNAASCLGSICYDVFYLSSMMMISAQLTYLDHFLSYKIREDSIKNSMKMSNTSEKSTSHSVLKNKLKLAKAHHVVILRFIESLENLTSPVMFFQCIQCIGIICMVSFELTTMKLGNDMTNIMKFWSMVEYISASGVELLAFSYYASKVTSLELQVANSAFNCGWESLESENSVLWNNNNNEERRDRRAVCFMTQEMILRSQKPVLLTGGRYYILSLETFTAVMSAAFSYSTVLRSFGDEE